MFRECLLCPHRPNEEQVCPWLKTQQVMHPFQGLVIAPLQVVKQEQQWLTVGAAACPCPQHCACQGHKKVLALPTLRHGSGVRQIWPLREQIGHEPRYLSEPYIIKS